MQCVLSVLAVVEGPNQKFCHKKNFLLQARSGAQNQFTDRGGEFNGFKSNQTMHYNYWLVL